MRRSKTQILDSDPNSIYGASKKLATIAVHNMNNPSDNDGMSMPLDSILKQPSTSSLLPARRLPLPNSSSTTTFMTKANTDVDEFLGMIKETNLVLESINILLENTAREEDDDDEEEEVTGSALLGVASSHPRMQGGMQEPPPDSKMSAEEQERQYLLSQDELFHTPSSVNVDLNRIYPNDSSLRYEPSDDNDDENETKLNIKKYKNKLNEVGIAMNSLDDKIVNYEFANSHDKKVIKDLYNNDTSNGSRFDPITFLTQYEKLVEARENQDVDLYHKRLKAIKKKYPVLNNYDINDHLFTKKTFDDYDNYIERKKLVDNLQNEAVHILDLLEKENSKYNVENSKKQTERRNTILKQRTKQAELKRETAENLLSYSSKTNPVVDLYTKFNTKMNQLYVFYKGKIKPNLKSISISKMKIEEIKEDIDILFQNYEAVGQELYDTYIEIFNISGMRKDRKVNAFFDSIEKNVDKIFADIISNVKSYSSVQITGSGLPIVPNSVLRNMNQNHKYLL
nr:MAG: hypothetical protein [Lake Baikal virophage 9]